MKDSRKGESLWFIWDGCGYESFHPEAIVFYTLDHIDLDEDVVRRALASSLQREGIAFSLGFGFSMIDSATTGYGYVGTSDESEFECMCDETGLTESGEQLDTIVPITWVEVIEL